MKQVLKALTFSVIVLFAFSCEDLGDNRLYDVDNGTTLAGFQAFNIETIPLSDTSGTFFVPVGVSTRSGSDRSISLGIDPSSTIDAAAYTIDPASLVIPAGEFSTQVAIDFDFDEIPESGTVSLNLSLASVDGADVIDERLKQINVFRFCPFQGGANFIGDYQLDTQVLGIFGTPTLTDGVVRVTQGATVADRQFSVSAYPAFGSFAAFTFQFSLVCGEIVVAEVPNINVGCGGANGIGPSAAVTSTYAEDDDSQLVINFVDDIRGQCQPSVEVQVTLTKL